MSDCARSQVKGEVNVFSHAFARPSTGVLNPPRQVPVSQKAKDARSVCRMAAHRRMLGWGGGELHPGLWGAFATRPAAVASSGCLQVGEVRVSLQSVPGASSGARLRCSHGAVSDARERVQAGQKSGCPQGEVCVTGQTQADGAGYTLTLGPLNWVPFSRVCQLTVVDPAKFCLWPPV